MLVARDAERVLFEEETLAALGYEPGFIDVDAALAACRTDPNRFDMAVVEPFGLAARSLQLAAALHAPRAFQLCLHPRPQSRSAPMSG